MKEMKRYGMKEILVLGNHELSADKRGLELKSRGAGCPVPEKGKCWRCSGLGEVEMPDGDSTPCGACLGTEAPIPCPKCGKDEAMLCCMSSTIAWRCRQCHHLGPEFTAFSDESDMKALKAWNTQGGDDNGHDMY